jgi:hypothetical protein
MRVDEPGPPCPCFAADLFRACKVDDLGRGLDRDTVFTLGRSEERFEEDAAMEAEPEEALPYRLVGEIDERLSLSTLAEQTIDARPARDHVHVEAESTQDVKAGRL